MNELIREEQRNLEKHNIHELRALGKKIGVKSPASLNKKDLVDQILEIKFGKKSAVTETRGRPMKKVYEDYEYNVFSGFGELSVGNAAGYNDPYKYNIVNAKLQSGIIEISPSGYGTILIDGFVHNLNDVYVPASVIASHELKDGDTVAFEFKMVGKTRVISKIHSVNGVDVKIVKNRTSYSSLKPSYPTEKFDLYGSYGFALFNVISPIGKGSRNIIVGGAKCGKTSLVFQMADIIKVNNDEAYISPVYISKSAQEIEKISNNKSVAFVYTPVNYDPKETIRILSISVYRAMRYAELGKDVLIIIDDLNSCLSDYLKIAPSTEQGKQQAINYIKSIFALGGKLSNGGSLSIIGVIDDSNSIGVALKEELNQVVDSITVLDNDLVSARVFPAISISNSLSSIAENVLTGEEILVASKIRQTYLTANSVSDRLSLMKKFTLAKQLKELK